MSLDGFIQDLKNLNQISKNQELKEQFANLLYDEYYQQIFNYYFLMTRRKETAEEETQEVLLKILNTIPQFNPTKAKLKTWIWVIAKRHIIDHYRLKENKITPDIFQEEIHSEEILNEQLISTELLYLIEKENSQNIKNAVEKINGLGRDILVMWLETDLSMDELANVHDISVQQVKNYLFQSKKKLKDLLSKDFEAKRIK